MFTNSFKIKITYARYIGNSSFQKDMQVENGKIIIVVGDNTIIV